MDIRHLKIAGIDQWSRESLLEQCVPARQTKRHLKPGVLLQKRSKAEVEGGRCLQQENTTSRATFHDLSATSSPPGSPLRFRLNTSPRRPRRAMLSAQAPLRPSRGRNVWFRGRGSRSWSRKRRGPNSCQGRPQQVGWMPQMMTCQGFIGGKLRSKTHQNHQVKQIQSHCPIFQVVTDRFSIFFHVFSRIRN